MVTRTEAGIAPEAWPSERPLFIMVLLTSLALWAVFLLTVVGLL